MFTVIYVFYIAALANVVFSAADNFSQNVNDKESDLRNALNLSHAPINCLQHSSACIFSVFKNFTADKLADICTKYLALVEAVENDENAKSQNGSKQLNASLNYACGDAKNVLTSGSNFIASDGYHQCSTAYLHSTHAQQQHISRIKRALSPNVEARVCTATTTFFDCIGKASIESADEKVKTAIKETFLKAFRLSHPKCAF